VRTAIEVLQRFSWVLPLAAGFLFAGAEGRPVWASAAGGPSVGAAFAPSTSGSPIIPEGVLAGTFVVEGGRSFALFQPAEGFRLVREGDEIVAGVRLVKVRTTAIVVERDGLSQEIPLKLIGGGAVAGRSGLAGSRSAGGNGASAPQAEQPASSIEARQVDRPQQRWNRRKALRSEGGEDNP
jgi:hypothetical protein